MQVVSSSMNLRVILVFLCVSMGLSACQIGRMIWYNFAAADDYRIFPSRPLHKSATPLPMPSATARAQMPGMIYNKQAKIPFEQFLKQSKTLAFVVLKNDSVVFEHYANKHQPTDYVASFSMAKSYISALVGIAIEEGKIKSIEQPIIDYLPELKAHGLEKVTVKHLLQMTSGIKFSENYLSPFSEASRYYYSTNLYSTIKKLKPEVEAGTRFEYMSGNSQLLGMVLDRALAPVTVTQYLQDKIWQPCGMQNDATWSVDRKKNGVEKTFCCLNATALDFARFGTLYLHNGKFNDRQIVPKAWVEKSYTVDLSAGSSAFYQNQWRIASVTDRAFYAAGYLGQFIYVNQAEQIVIVRLGKDFGDINWIDLFHTLASTNTNSVDRKSTEHGR